MSRARILIILTIALMALASGSHSRYAYSEANSSELVVLASAAIQGELAPCG